MEGLPEVPGVTHRRVRTERITIHVAEAGEGPPLLLVHGWPQHWWCWRHLIPELARSHRVICPDLRGLGWSDAPPQGYDKQSLADDLLALLDALGLDTVAYVGHDWGAYAGYLLARRAPERIERIAITGIVAPGEARVDLRRLPLAPLYLSYQLILATPLLGPLSLTATSALLKTIFRVWPAVELADIEPYLERLRQPERARASGLYYRTFLLGELLRDSGGELEMPVLRLLGEDDFLRKLAADAPGTQLIPGAGHFLQEEQPELVLEHLRRFLKGERPPDGRPPAATTGSRRA